MRAIHLSRDARARHELEAASDRRGGVGVTTVADARRAAARINLDRAAGRAEGPPTVTAGELIAVGVLHEVFHRLVEHYDEVIAPGSVPTAVAGAAAAAGPGRVERTVRGLTRDFGAPPLPPGHDPTAPGARPVDDHDEALVEGLLLSVVNDDPAAAPLRDLFDDRPLRAEGDYPTVLEALEHRLAAVVPQDDGAAPADSPFAGRSLVELLRAPAAASPTSLAGQLRWIRDNWAELLAGVDGLADRLLLAADLVEEDGRALHQRFGGAGRGPVEVPRLAGLDVEVERFSDDTEWMPRVVLQAKATYVWLHQLSRRYGREIRTLDAIPDDELDRLAGWGVTGLWLIGLWQRSRASEEIKHRRGNPDAVASAYSLDDYRIADDLGGEGAYAALRDRAAARGIRLASDMVPNHMGLDSSWVVRHPDWFLAVSESPYPAYTFDGPDLSSDPGVEITLEDHYWNDADAAVVFRRRDRGSGETRYIYHGNDGTSFPWNDTAQLDFLQGQVREAVIQTILEVARRFPIIRFDAAMVLAKRHVRRLWWPEPGAGGGIPSRAEHAISQAAFDAAMPNEFWREVVDRVATEVPGTLLLAEAFWLMEGFFVRTLGMHRVYNSAFMHMLRDENGAGYRKVIRETIEFDPAILGRYVNFMSNPDEETAIEQFGDGDKYFGVATVLATLPGLPMLGHGQVEGLAERYGMEFRRPTRDESPNPRIVERHEREIVPLLRQRRRFAGSSSFRLYDLTGSDGVDEHVYAYTNGAGADRSLVVYHDRFGTTTGWIRHSSPFAVKDPDGGRHLELTSLADALGVGSDPAAVVTFRDPRSGYGLAVFAGALRERGLSLRLDAYESRAFTEIEEHPASDSAWQLVAARLDGRAAASLDDAVAAVRHEDLHRPVRAALDAARAGDADRLRIELGVAARAAGFDDPLAAAAVDGAERRLHGLRAATTGAGTARPAPRAPRSAVDPTGAEADRAWAALAWLDATPAGRRKAFDDRRLGWPIAASTAAAGIQGVDPDRVVELTRRNLGLPLPGDPGVPRPSDPRFAAALATELVADAEAGRWLGSNEHEGIRYVNAEAWNDVATVLGRLTTAAVSSAADRRSAADLRDRLVAAGTQAGYRVSRIIAELAAPPAARPGTPAAAPHPKRPTRPTRSTRSTRRPGS